MAPPDPTRIPSTARAIIGFHPSMRSGDRFLLCIHFKVDQYYQPTPEQNFLASASIAYVFDSSGRRSIEFSGISGQIYNTWAFTIGPNVYGIEEGIYVLIYGMCGDAIPATVEVTCEWIDNGYHYFVRKFISNRSTTAVVRENSDRERAFFMALQAVCIGQEARFGHEDSPWRSLVGRTLRGAMGTQNIMFMYY
ncbi:hypothetical protein FHL15_005653 [Xylaria flabelliformis]|uniref:Uncharacterized protein n=1 Tax=Xylaria flabelliformis TaxID=2512241 RepID=A0A553HZJ4_9PEZI|nr:hypothetical protein FHL15_005653 [Xylaria flabelliformis]